MSLVDDNAKMLILEVGTNCLKDIWELMDNRDDDLLATLQMVTEFIRRLCPSDKVLKALEGHDVVLDLLVEIHSVSNYDHRIEQSLCAIQQIDQLISEPCDGVRLARTCRVLNQEALTDSSLSCGFQQRTHTIHLMITWPDDRFYLFAVIIGLLDYLGIVLNDVRQRLL